MSKLPELFCLGAICAVIVCGCPAWADRLDSNGVLVSDNNQPRELTQDEAKTACPVGNHLPTARELAQYSQSLGAAGIKESSEFNPNGPHGGWYKISAKNADGTAEEFYFYEYGYKPFDSLRNKEFWSSSVITDDPYRGWSLSGGFGILDFGKRQNEYYQTDEVMCFPNK